jgi:hypothetical protein
MMKSAKTTSGASTADKRVFLFSLTVFISTVVILFVLNNRAAPAPVSSGGQPPVQRMTLEPAVIDNLTDFPSAPTLVGELADQIHLLQTRLDACSDFGSERRSQMQQHIDWLLNPSTIPRDILIALGANPNARLIFGMATYTSIEWGLRDKSTDSCLLPIGQMLNQMLTAQGEPPLPEFE